jgi:hypothetical protein
LAPNETRWIWTETPVAELWRHLGQYRYPPNISRYLAERGLVPASGIENYVAGSIGQAEAYFTAGLSAPLDISPLLLYYGTTSLLSGAAALMTGQPLAIDSHGMAISPSAGSAARVSDVEVVVRNTNGSGLKHLASVYDVGCALPPQSAWRVGELLASLPDLQEDVRLCLPTEPPFVLRMQMAQAGPATASRIPLREFGSADVDATLARVADLKAAYLQPQSVSNAIVLYQRINGKRIHVESLSGAHALLVCHQKDKNLVTTNQIVSMLMALFALGNVSRYSAELWHPFVRTDSTGERLLVERFLSLVVRWLPNLVLNSIRSESVRFTAEATPEPRAPSPVSREEVGELVKEAMSDRA